jgi:hypothetical protein
MADLAEGALLEVLSYVGDPKEIMNLGLVSRRLHSAALDTLLARPEARLVRTYFDAIKLGWPCVLALHEPASPRTSDIVTACIRRDRRRMRALDAKNVTPFGIFLLGKHPRLGGESPVLHCSDHVLQLINAFI